MTPIEARKPGRRIDLITSGLRVRSTIFRRINGSFFHGLVGIIDAQ